MYSHLNLSGQSRCGQHLLTVHLTSFQKCGDYVGLIVEDQLIGLKAISMQSGHGILRSFKTMRHELCHLVIFTGSTDIHTQEYVMCH